MAFHGVEHIGYVVRNPAQAARWYFEHLGFKVLRAGTDTTASFIQCPRTRLIVEFIAAGDVRAAVDELKHPLQVHFAVKTDDFEKDRQRLIDAGAEHAMDNPTTIAGARVGIVKDPFGMYIQLAQRPDDFYL